MKPKSVAAPLSLFVVALAVSYFGWRTDARSGDGSGGATLAVEAAGDAARAVARPDVADRGALVGTEPAPGRTAAAEQIEREAPAAELAPRLAPADDGYVVRGRVLDAEGRPRAGVGLAGHGFSAALVSGAGGRFELAVDVDQGALACSDEAWVTALPGAFRRGTQVETLVVVAPAVRIAGQVVDVFGESLANASLRTQRPADFEARFDQRLEQTSRVDWRAVSDRDGRFELPRCGAVFGATLYCALEGYEPLEVPLPLGDEDALRLVLEAASVGAEGALRGRVVDRFGVPAEGARVVVGLATVLTDAGGLFEVDLARAVTHDRVVAVKPGALPATLELEGGGSLPEFVELRLGLEPLTIAGVVVDSAGEPLAGVEVFVDDPTPCGSVGMSPLQTEFLLAGGRVLPEAIGTAHELPGTPDGGGWNRMTWLKQPSALHDWATTDARGRFEIEGLLERDYTIKAIDPRTLLAVTSLPTAAGSRGVEVRLPTTTGVHRRFAGTVVGANGPVPRVQVRLYSEAFVTATRIYGGRLRVRFMRPRESVVTDDEGRFAFRDVPRSGVMLGLLGDDVVPLDMELERDVDAEDFVVEVDVRNHFRLELADADLADHIAASDGDGTGLSIIEIRAGYMNMQSPFPIAGGSSSVLSLSSTARNLHLLKDGATVETIPIELQPGEVNVIRR